MTIHSTSLHRLRVVLAGLALALGGASVVALPASAYADTAATATQSGSSTGGTTTGSHEWPVVPGTGTGTGTGASTDGEGGSHEWP